MTVTPDLAERLYAARRDDQRIPLTGGPTTLDEALAVQLAVDALEPSEIVGYKAGATVAAALDTLKLEAPFHGRLRAAHHMGSGARFTLPRAHPVSVETEFVIAIGEDLSFTANTNLIDNIDPARVARVADAVAWVAPGFELVGSRFDMTLPRNGFALISDAAGNVATIAGDPVAELGDIDLATHEAVLSINGEEKARGAGGDSITGHPYAMIAWLLSQPAVAARGIKAGEFIYCGTCTGAISVSPGDILEADFGALGSVSVTLD